MAIALIPSSGGEYGKTDFLTSSVRHPVSRPAQRLAGLGAGMDAVLHHDGPVHDHVPDAGGKLVRLFIRGDISDRLWIEHYDVGVEAGKQQATIRYREPARRRRRHLADCFFERHYLLLAYEFAEDAREGAVRSRMREAARFRIYARTVGTNFDPRLLQLHRQILRRHEEVDRLDAAALGEHEVHGGVAPVLLLHLRDLGKTLAGESAIFRAIGGDDEDILRSGEHAHVFPLGLLLRHLGADLRANGRVGEIVE